MSAIEPAITVAPPDWNASEREVVCPLCDYNLRGLVEPRCPECGYRFEWPELLDPARRPHPYLFEHHPERNVRSFLRTYFAGLRPRRFWRTLRPIHAIRPRRLAAYYVITTALFLLAPIVMFVPPWVVTVRDQLDNRAFQRAWMLKNPALVKEAVDAHGGSIDAYMDTWPSPYWGPSMWANLRHRLRHDASSINVVAVALLWPWMTFATLMLFRASMRRATVKRGHVLRCTLYGCDWTAWFGGIALWLFTTGFAEQWLPIFYPPAAMVILAAALFATYTTYRLGSAYKLYLQFDRPYATVLAAQLIVLLLVASVAALATGG